MGIFRNDDDSSEGGGEGLRILPLLPLRDIVVFPGMVVPLFVGRARSIRALDEAMSHGRELVLCAQREAGEDEPGSADVTPLPKWIEHGEPGGVNWTTRNVSPLTKSASSRHPSPP